MDGGADGGSLAAVLGVLIEMNLRKGRCQTLENVEGAVGGTIVDDDQLALHILGDWGSENQGDAPLHNGALIVNRHQDRQLHETKTV